MSGLCRCPVMDKLEKELEEPITSTQTWLIKSVGLLFCKAIQDYASDTTVKPVRHGKWIFESICGHAVMTCSECLKVQSGQTLCFTYCPNCGARMDKDD